MTLTREETLKAVNDILEKGPTACMREREVARGYTLIPLGDRPWFQPADWYDNCVMSLDGKHVRIVGVSAKRIGTGAFSRLVEGIIRDGLQPVVVCPMGHMEAILTRWGWTKQHHSEGADHWFPTRKWKAGRVRT